MKNKESHNIDQLFKGHFDAFQYPVSNTDELWSEISQKKDQRRAGAAYWWMGMAAMMIGFLAIYFIYSNVEDSVHVQTKKDPTQTGQHGNARAMDMSTELTSKKAEEKIGFRHAKQSTQDVRNFKSEHVSYTVHEQANEMAADPEQHVLHNNNNNNNNNNNTAEVQSIPRRSQTLLALQTKHEWAPFVPIAKKQHQPIKKIKSATARKAKRWDQCKVGKNGQWWLGVYGQAAKLIESVGGESEFAQVQSQYKTSFSSAYGMGGGLLLGYQFDNGIRMATGLDLWRYQTKYEYESTIIETLQIYDPMAYYTVNTDGTRNYVGDTVTVSNVYQRSETKGNELSLYSIPLQLGYHVSNNDWIVGVDLTAYFHILHQYEGYYIDKSASIISIDQDNQEDYMSTDFRVSADIGIHFGRMIGEHTELYVSPRFRYSPSSHSSEGHPISLTHHLASVRMGFNYYF